MWKLSNIPCKAEQVKMGGLCDKVRTFQNIQEGYEIATGRYKKEGKDEVEVDN